MSYEIVRSIRITRDKVFGRAASNNVTPKDYTETEWPYYSKLLVEQGREAVEKQILWTYFIGCFHPGQVNKYAKAVRRFEAKLTEDHHEEYLKCCQDGNYKTEFLQKLHDELKNSPKKQPCCIKNPNGLRVRKITSRHIFYGVSNFKTYHDPEEAEYDLKNNDLDKRGFQIELL